MDRVFRGERDGDRRDPKTDVPFRSMDEEPPIEDTDERTEFERFEDGIYPPRVYNIFLIFLL